MYTGFLKLISFALHTMKKKWVCIHFFSTTCRFYSTWHQCSAYDANNGCCIHFFCSMQIFSNWNPFSAHTAENNDAASIYSQVCAGFLIVNIVVLRTVEKNRTSPSTFSSRDGCCQPIPLHYTQAKRTPLFVSHYFLAPGLGCFTCSIFALEKMVRVFIVVNIVSCTLSN